MGADGGVPGGELLPSQQQILLNPLQIERGVAAQQLTLGGGPGRNDPARARGDPACSSPWITASTRAGALRMPGTGDVIPEAGTADDAGGW